MDGFMKFIAVVILSIFFFIGYLIYQMYKDEIWRKDNNCIVLSDVFIEAESYFPYRKKYLATMDCNGKKYQRFHN